MGLEVLTPRKPLVSVAYSQRTLEADHALLADDADQIDGQTLMDLDGRWVNEDQANSVTGSMITDGEITDDDVSVTADIDPGKISGTAWTADNDGTGSGLDADMIDGLDSGDFLSTANDYGRSGVATDLYEGSTALGDKYVNQDDLDHLDASDGDPANAVYVDDAGQVGIGTTSPARALHVAGAVEATTYYGDGSNLTGIAGAPDADWTIVGDDIYHETGNVGIGTTSPAERLDVDGNIKASGTLSSGSSITINGTTHEISSDDTLNLFVNGSRALRIEPNAESPNWIGGFANNKVTSGVIGATICGGGESGDSNYVTDDYGTVGGGKDNQAGDNSGTTTDRKYATVSGGLYNWATGFASTVSGGSDNRTTGNRATVGGGSHNEASGDYSTVGGGYWCIATGDYSTVSGGTYGWLPVVYNEASGYASTVGGGSANVSSGQYAAIPGGRRNEAQGDYSFAAGSWARALHTGTFVWADSLLFTEFSSTGSNQFLIRAKGGVGIGTNSPLATQHIQDSDILLPSDALHADVLIVEDADAILGLYSSAGGDAGSAIAFGEITGGALVDKWGIVRETAAGGKGLRITYGTDKDQFNNTTMMYLDDSGKVGIGTISPGYKLQVGNSGDGTEARANAWNTFSSRNYKKDITALQPCDYEEVLRRLGQLDVVKYHYKGDADDRKLRIGLIAEDAPQEMTSEDGKAMSLSDSIGFLIAAVKAQQEQIGAQQDRIGALEEEIEILNSQLRNRR